MFYAERKQVREQCCQSCQCKKEELQVMPPRNVLGCEDQERGRRREIGRKAGRRVGRRREGG